MAEEYTGGSVSYYAIKVERPTNPGADPYTAECNDIIEALGMNYAEGNAFTAIWRRCAARLGKSKKGYTDGLYDAEKVVFFGQRLVAQEKAGYSENGTDMIVVAAQTDAFGWLDWCGDLSAIPACSRVDINLRDGSIQSGRQSSFVNWSHNQDKCDFDHHVIKYRIHKEQ